MKTSRKKRLRSLAAALFFLTAVVLLVWSLPVFHLSELEVSQLRTISREEIISLSGLTQGQHLLAGLGGTASHWFSLRYAITERRLLDAVPTIKSVTVRMDFPGKIQIDIDERIEVAYIRIPDGCVMIDKDGVALSILPAPPGEIPVIEGVTVASMTLGKPLTVDVPSALHSAMTLMGAIIDADQDERTDLRLLPQIRKIMPIGGRQLYLTVVLPNTGEELSVEAETGSEQREDMLWLRFALGQGVFDGRGKGVLDLTGSRKTFTPD
jgi:cell division septal protein FtsQ